MPRDFFQNLIEVRFVFIATKLAGSLRKGFPLRPIRLLAWTHVFTMHILFTDESGDPPKRTAANPRPYFVIGGIAIPTALWHELSEELCTLKARNEYNIQGEIKWRLFGEQNPDKYNNVSHLTREYKDSFRREMFSIITRRDKIKIIACVCCVKAAYQKSYIKDENDIYEYTYKPVSERFQYYLQDISSQGNKELGLVVCDHRGRKQDDRLRSHHEKLITSASQNFSSYFNFVETLFLAPSHQSIGIQFADMVVGAIGRAFNANDPTFARLLRPSFRCSQKGKVLGFGLVKFPSTAWK